MPWYYDFFRVLALVVVWAIPATLVLAVAVFTVFAPTLTLAGIGVRLYNDFFIGLRSKVRAEMESKNLVCSTDADCPEGFVCVNGRCMLA